MFVHENVTGFPDDIIMRTLSSHYHIETVILNALDCGVPIARKRKYTLCRLRTRIELLACKTVRGLVIIHDTLVVSRVACESLSFKSTLPCLPTCMSRMSIDLVTVINDVCGVYDTVPVPTASDILSLKPDSWLVSELGRISDANKRRLDAYVQRLGGDTEHFAFDFSQNAGQRCRAAHPTHMSTLTKNCGLWYVPTLKRFMCSWVALHEHCLVFGSDTVTQ